MSTPSHRKAKLLASSAVLWIAGCQPDLRSQDRPHTQGLSRLYTNHMDARAPVPGAVAYHAAAADLTERDGDRRITASLLTAGQRGFTTFCLPCHGLSGDGDGMVVRHGFPRPPNLAEVRLRLAPDSYIYGVITQGAGAMPEYAKQISVAERWSIVAYVRALQLSQGGELGQEQTGELRPVPGLPAGVTPKLTPAPGPLRRLTPTVAPASAAPPDGATAPPLLKGVP